MRDLSTVAPRTFLRRRKRRYSMLDQLAVASDDFIALGGVSL